MTPRNIPHAKLAAAFETILRSPVEPTRPVWYTDQQLAAAAEAGQFFRACSAQMQTLQPDRRFREIAKQVDPAGAAEWVAAIVRCRWCCHMKGGNSLQPCIADLNHRRARCMRCAKTYLKPIVDDRCEVCDSTGHTRFRPVLVQVGGVVVAAEVAPCCWHLLGEVGDGE